MKDKFKFKHYSSNIDVYEAVKTGKDTYTVTWKDDECEGGYGSVEYYSLDVTDFVLGSIWIIQEDYEAAYIEYYKEEENNV